jgi:hypothetical protein
MAVTAFLLFVYVFSNCEFNTRLHVSFTNPFSECHFHYCRHHHHYHNIKFIMWPTNYVFRNISINTSTIIRLFVEINLLVYLLNYSMVQDILWKVYSYSACQRIAYFLYGTQRFITMFTKAHHCTLSWASRIQFASCIPIFLRSILMSSSHLCLCLPSGLFP